MLDDIVKTSIEIDADPATIYSILTDLSRYHEWNPQMFEARGDPVVGQKIWFRVKISSFQPTIIVADKDKQLTWRNILLGVPGLTNCDHSFIITPLVYEGDQQNGDVGQDDIQAHPGRVLRSRLDNEETFWGITVPALRLFGFLDEVKADFQKVNEALKKRAEEFAAANKK
ncbi:hypothetical protein DFQ26_006200 [Actinomortierella ambigua]|nr:hypothetical protein DFQ26_006200 [Actinomortierella ambigua]